MKPGWLLRVLYQFDLFLYSQGANGTIEDNTAI
jgi:hypothetical protein